jgi:hypothetical protein
MVTPKLNSIALWPPSFTRQGDLHVGIAPALLPVLSKKDIIESSLQDTQWHVCMCLSLYFVSSIIHCITYVCHSLSLADAQRVVQPNTGDTYSHLHICARRAWLGVDDSDARGPWGTSPSKCGAANMKTYSNRSLLTCARLGSTTKRP